MARSTLVLCALLLLACLPAILGQPRPLIRRANITIPTGPGKPCPQDPLSMCDFYFQGFRNQVPTLPLRAGMPGDMPISPILRSRRNPNLVVFVALSGPEFLFEPVTRNTMPNGLSRDINNLFYLGGKPARLRLRQNTLPPNSLDNRCIMLPIQNAQVTTIYGGQMCNLNPWAQGNRCPENHPCVIFRTK